MPSGTMKRWNSDKGFGFIQPEDGGDDLFCHVSGLLDGEGSVEEGDGVRFKISFDERKDKISFVVVDVEKSGGGGGGGGRRGGGGRSRSRDGAGRSAQSGSGAASKASGLNEDDETGKALAYRREVLLMVRHCMERQVTRLSEAEDIASPCRGIRSLFLPSSIATAEAGETSASGTKLRNKATVGEGVAAEADGESASFHWNAKAVEFVPFLAPLPSVVSKRGLLPRTPPGNWWAASVHPARPVAVGLQPGTRPHAAELRPKCLKPVAQACKPTAKTFNPQATEFVPGQAGQRQVHKSMTYSEDAQSAGAESESTSAGEEDALSCTEVGAQSPSGKQSAPWEESLLQVTPSDVSARRADYFHSLEAVGTSTSQCRQSILR